MKDTESAHSAVSWISLVGGSGAIGTMSFTRAKSHALGYVGPIDAEMRAPRWASGPERGIIFDRETLAAAGDKVSHVSLLVLISSYALSFCRCNLARISARRQSRIFAERARDLPLSGFRSRDRSRGETHQSGDRGVLSHDGHLAESLLPRWRFVPD